MIELYINGKNAAETWGLKLTHGALAALMTPPPMKERIVYKSRISNGAKAITNPQMEKVDERSISLPVHFVAISEADFLSKYYQFCNELKRGILTIEVKLNQINTLQFNTYYVSCTSYSHFYGGIAKFVLKVQEYNPAND